MLTGGVCVTGVPEAYFCCPQTCGHCEWVRGPKDMEWEILTNSGASLSPTCNNGNYDDVRSNTHHDKACCLPEGEYEAKCVDREGDGWGYGSLSIQFDGEMHPV